MAELDPAGLPQEPPTPSLVHTVPAALGHLPALGLPLEVLPLLPQQLEAGAVLSVLKLLAWRREACGLRASEKRTLGLAVSALSQSSHQAQLTL